MKKLTFFRLNRFYLLGALFFSFVIPALQFEVKRELAAVEINQLTDLHQLKPVSNQPFQLVKPLVVEYQPQEQPRIDWNELGFYIYGGIASILLLACAWRLFGLLKHTSDYTNSIDGLKLITKTKGYTNCSFFNYVFIDKSILSETELQVLLTHEKVHASQYHSIDKIILMLCKAFLWFNPVVYLIDKALEQTHEYEADEAASLNFGTNAYANLLFKLAVTKSEMPLIHNFVKSPVKERIKMLFNAKSAKMKKLSYLLALPITISLIWLFSVQLVYAAPKLKSVLGLKKIEQPIYKQVVKTAKGVLVNRNSKTILKVIDTTRLQSSIDPKIISSSKIRGNLKTKISYLEDVVIEIKGTTIKAKSAVWNKNVKELLVSHAVIIMEEV
ncbi:M56 family metallopeptidase [Pedobacter rhodius]|uniref:Peptidase M56 domain-containing protein n=1 Tax=Pedobacter rhodius TaxID=3004098 RepID=A0ABT4L2E7_9SPHI|nr:M56 family metallopeptidase [Pedobacter sp. SJ11]MCZ4225368.1 hypothetical protein [Pedobacter sp. SJ11]